MKTLKYALTGLLLIAGAGAIAQSRPVPDGIRATLKIYRVAGYTLVGDTLRVQLTDQMVASDIYESLVRTSLCSEQFRSPTEFANSKIDRIELLNAVDAQGFALLDVQRTCKHLGTAPRADGDALFKAQTVRCEAGVCRRREN